MLLHNCGDGRRFLKQSSNRVPRSLDRFVAQITRRSAGLARLPLHISLTRAGWCYAFVVLCAFTGSVVRDSNPMLLLAGMLVSPLALSLGFALGGLRRIEVSRQLPSSVCVGERLTVELACSNQRRRLTSWAVVVEDVLRYEGPLTLRRPIPARVLFPYVPPGQTSRTTYEGLPPVRGRYRLGPIRLVTRYPLGLIRYEKTLAGETSLIVWPRIGRLTPGGLRLEERGELGIHRTERRKARLEADFYGLRDWRSGDSRRWIHWRSTARRGQVVVRQFDESRSQDLAIYVDLWQPADANAAARERIETAISLAASILIDACRRGGCRLALHLSGAESSQHQGWASQALLREMLDALSLARPRHEIELPADFTRRLAEVRPPLTALLIGTRPLELDSIFRNIAGPGVSIAGAAISRIDVGSAELDQYFVPGA